jgi:O-antigen/teichoic acid export membrane protein
VVVVRPQLILSIFGGYADAAPILMTLTLGGFLVVLIGPVSQVMLVAGLERDARTYTLVLLALAAIGLPLLAQWGTVAVSVGTAGTSLAYAVACWVRLGRAGIDVGPVSLHRAPTRSES